MQGNRATGKYIQYACNVADVVPRGIGSSYSRNAVKTQCKNAECHLQLKFRRHGGYAVYGRCGGSGDPFEGSGSSARLLPAS